MILTIRTDNPIAEVGLFSGAIQLEYETWHAHRELSATLHRKIKDILDLQNFTLQDLKGIVCFEGPGSFTGLRIGLTVANTLAYALNIPISGAGGENWIQQGINRLQNGQSDPIALPKYGANPHITLPRK